MCWNVFNLQLKALFSARFQVYDFIDREGFSFKILNLKNKIAKIIFRDFGANLQTKCCRN